MQINKISSNKTTPAFGAKLVFRKGTFPDDKTKKIIQKFENKTKNIDGTIYAVGYKIDDRYRRSQYNVNIYYKNNDYQDAVILNGEGTWNAINNNAIEIMSRLLDTFKIRETAVNATKATREKIKKLEKGINTTFEKMHKDVDETLDFDLVEISGENAYNANLKKRCKNKFTSSENNGHQELCLGFNPFDTTIDSFEKDCKYTNELFNKTNM